MSSAGPPFNPTGSPFSPAGSPFSPDTRQAILDAACRDPELLAMVSPVVAAGFGVLPLRRQGDVLTVACLPRANRQALRILRDVLELEIVATPFEDRLLHQALRRAYEFGDETVNFPTFVDPAFLGDPRSAAVLAREKVEEPGPLSCALPADRMALARMTYRSVLSNLDAPDPGPALPDPQRTRVDIGDTQAGWVLDGGQAHVYLGTSQRFGSPPLGDPPLVLTQYRFTDYRHLHGGARVSEHEVRTEALGELPGMIHPTEVQLVGIEANGGLVFHAYDRRERLAAPSASFELAYHFLSYGNRMRRRIAITLHDLAVVAREDVQTAAGDVPWGPVELARWFGLPAGKDVADEDSEPQGDSP